ncbi:hypothetical protein RHECNPAF_1020019 [Rhizobium etli CNPAF512]|nr:hypothetical protein RHECNPAF_1020019 [Rhizobium etli CNPAF512]
MTCLPADRPHDPGDAADLSIMGYRTAPLRERFCYEPIICAEMKENQQILNDEFCELDSMVKSPVLTHTKI